MSSKTENQAGKVQAESGVVIIDGPDAVALSMTPEAAAKMGKRMIDAAGEAVAHPETKEKRRRP
ncbi:hypothetical protein D3Y57_09545 [Sphingomonas paeninsulae]|jgi:hypothetical protein|uniref:Uncharacterized protein n=1 Tax=Sphingomonas paeninsulae TaxID=2319844 RepID=A0A494TFV8_SPHPE|nr:hypothetical protein [Sphingomonas paeninsulae]AYJ86162.1 hypothetical protein D3Y57_09545 [Sphingomonas paeninsulae]